MKLLLLILTISLFYGCSMPTADLSRTNSSNKSINRSVTNTIIEQTSKLTATVITANANLRNQPGKKGKILSTIPLGEEVEYLKQQGGWFLVKSTSGNGWLHGNTLRLNSPIVSTQTTLVASTSKATTEEDLKIKGNKNSHIYHLPGCASYGKIAEHNIIWFKTAEEAEHAGYRMARNC